MAQYASSDTFLVVKAIGADAATALRSTRNIRLNRVSSSFLVESDASYHSTADRESTPHVLREPETQLHLKFTPPPRDSSRGFIFGSDESCCDVHLQENTDKENRWGISRRQCFVSFNWNNGTLILNNTSRRHTGIKSPSINEGREKSLGGAQKQILYPSEETKVYIGSLIFEFCVPDRNSTIYVDHLRHFERYRQIHAENVPGLDLLTIETVPELTRSIERRQGDKAVYLLHDEIGRGAFGAVSRAKDCETGDSLAAKEFIPAREDWDTKALSEISAIKNIKHVFYIQNYGLRHADKL